MKYNKQVVSSYFEECGIAAPVYEYKFHPARKWRLDIAWPDKRVCVEVQGGIFIRGRHNRGAALIKEWEKLNALAVAGWRVLYCQPSELCMAEMTALIIGALYGREMEEEDGPCKPDIIAATYEPVEDIANPSHHAAPQSGGSVDGVVQIQNHKEVNDD